jgi:hypothetical protein
LGIPRFKSGENRLSNKIGALLKAQTELENPIKSLTATLESPLAREWQCSFCYAPLSAGLDIAAPRIQVVEQCTEWFHRRRRLSD